MNNTKNLVFKVCSTGIYNYRGFTVRKTITEYSAREAFKFWIGAREFCTPTMEIAKRIIDKTVRESAA